MVNSKIKGKRGELYTANFLKDLLGTNTKRTQQFKGTPQSADIDGIDGIHIENKFVENLNIVRAMEQAKMDCGDNIPVVFHKKNRQQLMLTIEAKDLLKFCELIVATKKIAEVFF